MTLPCQFLSSPRLVHPMLTISSGRACVHRTRAPRHLQVRDFDSDPSRSTYRHPKSISAPFYGRYSDFPNSWIIRRNLSVRCFRRLSLFSGHALGFPKLSADYAVPRLRLLHYRCPRSFYVDTCPTSYRLLVGQTLHDPNGCSSDSLFLWPSL